MMQNWTKKITTKNEVDKKININIKILWMVYVYVEKTSLFKILSMAYNIG